MEFRILGPLEVVTDGRPIDLGGQKQRALLGALLLERNRVVSSDRLIEALWEEEPPASARKGLQLYVSQLRKALGKDRLQTKAPGYLLRVEQAEVDVDRFQSLIERGALAEAMALWRGPPLAEFAYERFAQAEIARLEELRLICVERRIEAALASGSHQEIVGELEALVKQFPMREPLRCQLMLALYRAGRQADALDIYQHGRATLVDQLGIEPGRPLRDLHQAILNQDPVLDLPIEAGSVERASLAPSPPLVDRGVRDARKTVTVVSVQMGTSSPQPEGPDPEALRRVSGRAFAEVKSAVERHGGTIEVVSGDAIIAVFGLAVVHEDDAVRGIRAALETHDALLAFSAELGAEAALQLGFRIGVSTGGVVAGGDSAQAQRATGLPLTLSSRLAQSADPSEIVIDEATQQLVRDVIVAERAGDAWRLFELTDSPSRGSRRLVSPMIGRTRERRRLHDAFDQAVSDSSCQLFTVLGPAGVGKSRLVQELLRDLAGLARVARGRCLPYGEGITFWPVLEAIKEAVGGEERKSPAESRADLASALEGTQDAELMGQQVAEMIGLVEEGGGAEGGFAAVQALFEALARTEPLVLVFDDIHWGESTFLDLVEHIADWTREAPILLICLARPELLEARPTWGGGKVNATSVLLEPLTDDDCGLLIRSLVGRAELAGEVEARISEAAEGNPLFVEEVLSMLIDDGVLVPEGKRWSTTRDLASVPVPPTIQALLGARLDRLTAGERAVIERAAVEGKIFHQGSVAALAPDSLRPSIGTHLGTLVRRDLIRPVHADFGTERAFRFRHLLIRDAAYDSIPKGTRAELHELFARWLDGRTRDRTSAYEEIIGYHLEQAYRYRSEIGPVDETARALGREAARRLGSAGHRAFIRGDAAAAVNLFARAVPLLPADDPSRIDLVPNVRVVQGLSGDLSWADRVLTEAAAAAAATQDPRLEAHALVQHAFLRLFTEPEITPHELSPVAESAISVFEEYSDQLGLARAWRLAAQAHYLGRRGGASVDASTRALEHGRRAGDQLELREIVEWLCVALMLGPTSAPEASARCEDLLADIEVDPTLAPTVLSVLANVEAMQGHADTASRLLVRWRTAVDELGDSIWLSAVNFGFVALADDPAAAECELRPGYAALRRIGEKSHFSSVAGLLAKAVCAQGRYEEADQLSRESERAARPNDIHSHILWRTTRAMVLAHKGELEAAESLAREAVAFAAESDFLDSHGDALANLGELLDLAARPEEGISAFEQAVRLYEQKGNAISAGRARSRVDQLSQHKR